MGEVLPRRQSDRRRWMQRSCRTSGGGGVIRRMVAAAGSGRARRREAALDGARPEGFSHVDKQRRVQGILSDYRCRSGSVTQENYFCSDFGEFKRKRSSGNPTKPLLGEYARNGTEIRHSSPSVMVKLMGFDAASGVGGGLQKSSFSSPGANHLSSNESLLHMSSNISSSGSPKEPKYHLAKKSNGNVKPSPPPQNRSCIGTFGKCGSMQMEVISAKHNCSLSEKMSNLRHLGQRNSYRHQNHTVVLNLRHEKAESGGTVDISRKEEVHMLPYTRDKHQELSNSSEGRYWQALLDNALVRGNKLKCSETMDQEIAKQIWNSASSGSEKVEYFTSNESMDDVQVSASTDTGDYSDSYKLSTLCTVKSSFAIMSKEHWKMAFQKVYCPLAEHVDSISVADSKEAEQQSPVSVLEPPTEESSSSGYINQEIADPHELQMRLELVKFPSLESTAEEAELGGICDYFSSENEAIQLVEDIEEEFGDEEERDFSYLLDMLIASGIHGTEEDQLYKVCHSLDCPAGHDVFEKLEKKYDRLAQWSRSDRNLLFDIVNSILSEILAPCLDLQPWVSTARKVGPMWGSEGLLEKVLQMLAQRREELALSKPEKKAFDQKWPDLVDSIDMVGRKIERMIKEDLLEELVLELLFG